MKLTFDEWLKEVDKWCNALCGCSYRDLPDCCYADWYEDGVSAKSAAKRAIRNEE